MDNYIIVDNLCEHYRQNINQPSVFRRHDYAEYEEKSPLVYAIEKQNYIFCESILIYLIIPIFGLKKWHPQYIVW